MSQAHLTPQHWRWATPDLEWHVECVVLDGRKWYRVTRFGAPTGRSRGTRRRGLYSDLQEVRDMMGPESFSRLTDISDEVMP